jgi:Ca2+/Na+ antiporter
MNCYRLAVGVFVIIVISVVVGYRLYMPRQSRISKAQSASETSIG